MESLTIPSFAKLNLILRVLDRRTDGFHTLSTLFQSIDLHDELTFRFIPAGSFSVNIDMQGFHVPADQSNLIYKACQQFHSAHPLSARLEISVRKRIPVESGLGGGSSNAAATLIALSRFYGWPLNLQTLHGIASAIGADVAFFLYGGSAFGFGKGDLIQTIDDLKEASVLLVIPQISCSTSVIYRKFDASGSLTAEGKSTKIRSDLRPESSRDFVSLIENDLEQVVFAQFPELDSIKNGLIERGASAAALTGSGSAIFGIFFEVEDRDRAARDFPGSICARFLPRQEYRKALGLKDFTGENAE
jgi:4-diphosphocytidyl-2-C-methyl-D-erythritol kinase